MTGKEAIAAVCRMTPSQRAVAAASGDTLLARVARWPVAEPVAWAEILAILGFVDWMLLDIPVPKRVGREALRKLWAQRAWTYDELAIATGYEPSTLRTYREGRWHSGGWQSVGRGATKAYQLLEREAA